MKNDEIDPKLLALALRTLVEQLPFDVWIRDAKDTMIFANEALRKRWGPGLEGRTVEATDVRAKIAETWRTVNARALAGETVTDEVTYDLDSGQQTIIGVVTRVCDATGTLGTVGINVDVTGERRARAHAHRLGQLLGHVFQNAPVAIGIRAVRGDDLVRVEDNPAAAALVGLTPDALRGVSEREIGVPADQIARMVARFREARAAGGPVSVELAYKEVDGSLKTLVGKAVAIDDPDEERYAFVAADISELRRLQSGIIRADRLASLGTLSASIGHEIGTSAAVALGQLEITEKLVERGAPAEEVLVGLRDAQQALHRAIGVLRDMRALAVGAALGSERCDVGAALDSVKEVLRGDLERHATLFERRADATEVTMSHSRLVQILLNLLRNAMESFGPGRGSIWIEVSRPSSTEVQVVVANDGADVPPPLLAKLFEPFVTTKADGTGLGLYVCHLLANLSKGRISARARTGGGLSVELVLPAA